MRKKSHISLAKYIVEDVRVPELEAHRKAFYLGSILPDCKPSFLTQRHEFDRTFDMVKERICDLSEDRELVRRNARAYMRHLGEVIHYIADYFTFPHNETYDGNLKDHCYYEKDLKFRLREYVKSGKVFWEQQEEEGLKTPEAVVSFIQTMHREYVSRKRNVEEDCRYIVRVCLLVVQAILRLIGVGAEIQPQFCMA
ncbi:MAG: zinc dependent phospholipase C family protein [Lachnospiraceae bacterium]|nr:zinc dependent phospholipase C family protein [Lachnospiraceae bacterium]